MIARFGKPVPVLCMINNYMIDYTYQAHSHRILQWNDSILQGKLKENILGRCLSTGATKFFKIVLADKKNQNGYVSCRAVCPFKSGKNIFFVKLLTFEWFSAANFRLVSVLAKIIYITFLTHIFVKWCRSRSASRRFCSKTNHQINE